VVYGNGAPAGHASVYLRRSDYLAGMPPDSGAAGKVRRADVQADAAGRFLFSKVDSGEYFIEAKGGLERVGLTACRIGSDGRAVNLDVTVLEAPGSIAGKVLGPDGRPVPALIRVYGLETLTQNDAADGRFALTVPPGIHSIRMEPFLAPAVLGNLAVESAAALQTGETRLADAPKLAFRETAKGLAIEGVTSANPILFDNDIWSETPDDYYLWAKASLGQADLRGNIVSRDLFNQITPFDQQVRDCAARVAEARAVGMRGVPDPTPGANGVIASQGTSGPQPVPSAGSDLIIAEARKASAQKPLLVFTGGPLTTVASAYLIDSTIAGRMVVFANFAQGENGGDSLAWQVVARKCRLVVWGRGYNWKTGDPMPKLDFLPMNRVGLGMRRFLTLENYPGFYGDVAHMAHVFSGTFWKKAVMARYQGTPLSAVAVSGAPFDFLDIPQEGNDWPVAGDEILGALGDTAVYHPHPVPGKVEAEGYWAMQGVLAVRRLAADSVNMDSLESGDWMEFRVDVETAGSYAVSLRMICSAEGILSLESGNGTTFASLGSIAFNGWQERVMTAELPAGVQVLRLRGHSGRFAVDALTFSP
jgi:hypothetical protein